MSVTVRFWEGSFSDLFDVNVDVKIYQNYPLDDSSGITYIKEGDLEFAYDPITIEKSTDQDIFDPLISTQCTIKLESDVSLKYAHFTNITVNDNDDYDTYRVVVEKDNITRFIGNISSEQYQEDWSQADGNKQVVTIIASCGLNNLAKVKRGSVGNLQGIWEAGERRSLQELIQILLTDTGTNLDLCIRNDLKPYNTSNQNGLVNMFVEPEVWSSADGYADNYTILTEILSTCGLGLVQANVVASGTDPYNDRLVWQIFRYSSISSTSVSNTVYHKLTRPNGEDNDYGYNESIAKYVYRNLYFDIKDYAKNTDIRQGYWVDSSQYILTEKGIEKQQINLNWIKRPNFIKNGEFNTQPTVVSPSATNLNYDQWYIFDTCEHEYTNSFDGSEYDDLDVLGTPWNYNGNNVYDYISGSTIRLQSLLIDLRNQISETPINKFDTGDSISYMQYTRDISNLNITKDLNISMGISLALTDLEGEHPWVYQNVVFAINGDILINTDGSLNALNNNGSIDGQTLTSVNWTTLDTEFIYGGSANGFEILPLASTLKLELKGVTLLNFIASNPDVTIDTITCYLMNPVKPYYNTKPNSYTAFDKFFIDIVDVSVDSNQVFFGGIDNQQFRKAGEVLDTRIGSNVNDSNSELYLSTIYSRYNSNYVGGTDYTEGRNNNALSLNDNQLIHVLMKSILDTRSRNVIRLNGTIRSSKNNYLDFNYLIRDADIPDKKFLCTNLVFSLYHNDFKIETIEITGSNLLD